MTQIRELREGSPKTLNETHSLKTEDKPNQKEDAKLGGQETLIGRNDIVVKQLPPMRGSKPSQKLAGEDKILLLLTPIIPHHPDTSEEDLYRCPFEFLGRAFVKYGMQVRHEQYKPSDPWRQIPEYHLRNSESVVLVVCEVLARGNSTGSLLGKMNSLDEQEKFSTTFEIATRSIVNNLIKIEILFGPTFGPFPKDEDWWYTVLKSPLNGLDL